MTAVSSGGLDRAAMAGRPPLLFGAAHIWVQTYCVRHTLPKKRRLTAEHLRRLRSEREEPVRSGAVIASVLRGLLGEADLVCGLPIA